ncbi:MAG TPA: helix-turn-helix domain-containing protein [Polyangiaceae bacterium]|nr:helix-turn-helix domain-containing protein [Polyangiaceae bacterium]
MSYYLERIRRGVDYVETKLDEDVALSDVAKAAGVSQWHFQRIFKALTGETLKTYIRSRRLAASLDRLLTTELRVLDIALMAGFESQEAFARAFKVAFGLTPQQYRGMRDKSLFLRKPRFDEHYLQQLARNDALTPELYDQKPLLLVGLRTLFYSVDSEKNNIGELLPPLWNAFLERLSHIPNKVPGVCYGIVRQEAADSERLEYHAAIEVTSVGVLPAGLVSVEVPAGRYARFEHRGRASGIDHTVSYAYAGWLAQSGHRHSYAPDLEIYGERYHPTNDDSVFHYAIPIAAARLDAPQDLP